MLRIFMAPQGHAGQRVLQADAATWQEVLRQFPRVNMPDYTALIAAVRDATGDNVKRVTLPDDLAIAVLILAEVSC